jgi:hypothetical protein
LVSNIGADAESLFVSGVWRGEALNLKETDGEITKSLVFQFRDIVIMSHMARDEMGNNLLFIQTIQAWAFRTLVDALKEILVEANLEFTREGMKILAMDGPGHMLVYCKLHAQNFNQ